MPSAKRFRGQMKIIFMGTPDFAVPSLNQLVANGHEIVAVYAQPPRPAGRKMLPSPSPVHKRAGELGLCVMTPASLRNAEEQASFAALGADIAVVAAYGLILPQPVLDAPLLGCINVHGSILPRWRGAAPVQRAILAGDAETGVTIMQLEAGLDTGPMRAITRIAVDGMTSVQLMEKLSEIGADLLLTVLADIDAHPPKPQPEQGITYATKIDKSEAHLDFLVSAPEVERQIRAFWPMAWFSIGEERYRILEADVLPPDDPANGSDPGRTIDDNLTIACNPGAIRVRTIQRAGKNPMAAAEMLRGSPIPANTVLS
jgi:methionyl-tRNA formyltransferase